MEDWRIERLRWSGAASASAAIEIDNPHGDVRCRFADGDEMSVTAIVQRHEEDPYAAELEVSEGERLRLEVVYAAREGATGGEVAEGMERRRVDLMVLVPAGPKLEIRTDGGLVEAKGLHNDVHAASATGDVVLSVHGSVAARSERGALDVTLRDPDWGDPARVESATGQITIWLPPGSDAVVEAATEGILSTDYSIDISRDAGGRRKTARAVLGSGARSLSAVSDKGDIRLFRLPGYAPVDRKGEHPEETR